MAKTLLGTAVELAQRSHAALCEAESCQDLAEVCGEAGRPDQRYQYLARAKELFARLAATIELSRVTRRIAELTAG